MLRYISLLVTMFLTIAFTHAKEERKDTVSLSDEEVRMLLIGNWWFQETMDVVNPEIGMRMVCMSQGYGDYREDGTFRTQGWQEFLMGFTVDGEEPSGVSLWYSMEVWGTWRIEGGRLIGERVGEKLIGLDERSRLVLENELMKQMSEEAPTESGYRIVDIGPTHIEVMGEWLGEELPESTKSTSVGKGIRVKEKQENPVYDAIPRTALEAYAKEWVEPQMKDWVVHFMQFDEEKYVYAVWSKAEEEAMEENSELSLQNILYFYLSPAAAGWNIDAYAIGEFAPLPDSIWTRMPDGSWQLLEKLEEEEP